MSLTNLAGPGSSLPQKLTAFYRLRMRAEKGKENGANGYQVLPAEGQMGKGQGKHGERGKGKGRHEGAMQARGKGEKEKGKRKRVKPRDPADTPPPH